MHYTVEVDNKKNIFWYKEGTETLHREDGPAIEFASGMKEWCLNGMFMSEQEHRRLTQPVKKMTAAEVVKELGYGIEIVEG